MNCKRENCNMLQKSLVRAVAKNATAPLKKLEVGTESPLKKIEEARKNE